MQVLLINPPVSSSRLVSKQYPLNLAYLGTYLENEGFGVCLADLNIEHMEVIQFKESLSKINPRVVGITAMTATIGSACRIAGIIKGILPGVKIAIGGPHVTALPEETLTICDDIDCVVLGEGEETFKELCMRVKNSQTLEGVKGIVHRSGGSIRREAPRGLIEDLNNLPFPRRDYIDISKYKKSHVSRGISRRYLNIAEMILSRGCPGRCIFCASNVTWHNKIRFRDIQNVLSEIEYCREKLDATHFSFEDDSFSFNRPWVESLCRELKKMRISWNCNVRVDMVTPGLLRLMAESGCIKVQFGIESGSQRILDLVRKNISLEQVQRAIEWAHQAKIRLIEGSFILGVHPEETLEDIRSTLRLIKSLKINLLMVSLACPFPGTKLYDLVKRDLGDNEMQWEDFIFYGARPVSTAKYLSGKQIALLQKKAYLNFYLRPKLIKEIWGSSRSFAEKRYWMTSGMHFVQSFIPSFIKIRKNGHL